MNAENPNPNSGVTAVSKTLQSFAEVAKLLISPSAKRKQADADVYAHGDGRAVAEGDFNSKPVSTIAR